MITNYEALELTSLSAPKKYMENMHTDVRV